MRHDFLPLNDACQSGVRPEASHLPHQPNDAALLPFLEGPRPSIDGGSIRSCSSRAINLARVSESPTAAARLAGAPEAFARRVSILAVPATLGLALKQHSNQMNCR